MNPSGRLDAAYCAWLLPRLQPGGPYELMCHPGRRDAVAEAIPAVRAYHDWTGELPFLTGDDFATLLRRHNVEFVPFVARPTAVCPSSAVEVTA
jgi:hypothetical protein